MLSNEEMCLKSFLSPFFPVDEMIPSKIWTLVDSRWELLLGTFSWELFFSSWKSKICVFVFNYGKCTLGADHVFEPKVYTHVGLHAFV